MQWFRHYHELSGDPKLSLVAQAAELPHIYAVGAWCYVLEQASAAEDRGSVAGIKARRMGSTLRITTAEAQRLLDAFHEEGMINDSGMVAAWDKRQRRSDSSLERVKAWREKKAAERETVTETVTPVTETPPNGTVTLQGEDVTLKVAPESEQNQIQNTPLNPPIGGENEPVSPKRARSAERRREPEGFVEFYAAYPKKQGRKDAARAYARACRDASREEIMAGLERSKAFWERTRLDEQYIPLPASWLNKGRWADQIEPADLFQRPAHRTRWDPSIPF